ncbi:PE-PPE domain-containing protein [Williamsia deligens]|uniref:PE-PPE domain-containing protein n=1 Tax=Williamsia deligens TaxID=321325 RepID=A0ABW3G4L8_9NOCA|nr:PE-PPE domain-containing protein [Williamsia deligens]MCP2194040.1 PE-PPE domain-containing protein [Williamsia deligens]
MIRRHVVGATAFAVAAALTVGVGGASADTAPPSSAPSVAAPTGGTILALGGNSNPEGRDMDTELSGYISGRPGTQYAGRAFRIVQWPAQTPFTAGWTGLTYDQSQQAGVAALETAVGGPHGPAGPVLTVGYSASAGVVMKTLRKWQQRRDAGGTVPSPERLGAVVFGDPNRPNGGVFARFPGLYAAPFGMTFDGAAPRTDYPVTDISWEYDGVSDFPHDPSNSLAMLNAAFGFLVHGSYKDADPTNTATIASDVTVGKTRYITIRNRYIPLLMPLYLAGVPTQVLDRMEPSLRARIEQAYDRSAGPGTPTPARIGAGQSAQKIIDRYVAAIASSRTTWDRALAQHAAAVPGG